MPNDSVPVGKALAQITTDFYKSIGQESRLYNGHEYVPYDLSIKGTALFPYDAKDWQTGEVDYDGILYKNVPMKYDIYKDEVVVQLYNKFSMFALLSDKVHDFSFGNHHFIRIEADQLPDNSDLLKTGFYDQLYNGKTELLARREKSLQSSSNTATTSETSFLAKDDYFLKKGNVYYKVSSKGSILKVLKDKKKELQQYLKQNHINYRDNHEDAMVKLASYYDHISN
jgi:hypothetical protein